MSRWERIPLPGGDRRSILPERPHLEALVAIGFREVVQPGNGVQYGCPGDGIGR